MGINSKSSIQFT